MSADPSKGRNGRHQYNVALDPEAIGPVKYTAPGVTTIVNVLAKDGLQWGAAKETAIAALETPGLWQEMGYDQALETLRRVFDRKWKRKAMAGTIVHDVALAWGTGTDYDVDERVGDEAEKGQWTGEQAKAVYDHVHGCVDALERFYTEQRPEWRYQEQPIIHPRKHYRHHEEWRVDDATSWCGTFDVDGTLADWGHGLWDYKTGSRYTDAVTMQMTGYKKAPLLAHYDDKGRLRQVSPYDAPDRAGVIYLRGDGYYEVLPLPVNNASYERFIGLRRQLNWNKEHARWAKAHPEPVYDSPEPQLNGDAPSE